jgi:type III restriction enzyme
VKNAGLGFSIPYFHNGKAHDYQPDFIVRLRDGSHVVVKTKGFDELADVKRAAAERWVSAVNADKRFGIWQFTMPVLSRLSGSSWTPGAPEGRSA